MKSVNLYESQENIALQWDMDIASSIVVINGISGTGKTMLGPLIGSFAQVENVIFDHLYEYLCHLHGMGKIDGEVVKYLMCMHADMDLYKAFIGRDRNLRIHDLSGIFSNPKVLSSILKLFSKDGEHAYWEIKKQQPILLLHMHQALPNIPILMDAFGKTLKVIEAVRHPVYLVDHWVSVVKSAGCDPRDFSILNQYEGSQIPWFAASWPDLYVKSNDLDKAIYSLDYLYSQGFNTYNKLLSEQQSQILWLPFEGLVTRSDKWIQKMCEHLDTSTTFSTSLVKRKQKIPRKLFTHGPAKSIYKRYGWKKTNAETEQKYYDLKIAEYKKQASPEAFDALMNLSDTYVSMFMSGKLFH